MTDLFSFLWKWDEKEGAYLPFFEGSHTDDLRVEREGNESYRWHLFPREAVHYSYSLPSGSRDPINILGLRNWTYVDSGGNVNLQEIEVSLFSPPSSPPLPPSSPPFPPSDVCDKIGFAIQEVTEMVRTGGEGEAAYIIPSLLASASLFLLLVGGRFFRVSGGMAALVFSFGISFYVISLSSASCAILLVGSSVIAVLSALLSSIFLKVGMFVCGSLLLCLFVHILFSSFPSLNADPTIAGKSLFYWAGILLSLIAGGVAVRFFSKKVAILLTSVIGGAGVAYSSRSILSLSGVDVQSWVLLLVAGGSSCFGIFFQYYVSSGKRNICLRKRRTGTGREE